MDAVDAIAIDRRHPVPGDRFLAALVAGGPLVACRVESVTANGTEFPKVVASSLAGDWVFPRGVPEQPVGGET